MYSGTAFLELGRRHCTTHAFSNVVSIVVLYSKCTRALPFENWGVGTLILKSILCSRFTWQLYSGTAF
jgi:hypothetical protein